MSPDSSQPFIKPPSRSAGLALLIISFITLAFRCSPDEEEMSESSINRAPVVALISEDGPEYRVEVEVAWTPDQRTRGLMYRTSLDENAGMLFIFQVEKVYNFWMKNTLIPLDMIFINSERLIVGIVENALPETENHRSVGEPSLYVLEVNGGYCAARGIKAGNEVQFLGLEEYGLE